MYQGHKWLFFKGNLVANLKLPLCVKVTIQAAHWLQGAVNSKGQCRVLDAYLWMPGWRAPRRLGHRPKPRKSWWHLWWDRALVPTGSWPLRCDRSPGTRSRRMTDSIPSLGRTSRVDNPWRGPRSLGNALVIITPKCLPLESLTSSIHYWMSTTVPERGRLKLAHTTQPTLV